MTLQHLFFDVLRHALHPVIFSFFLVGMTFLSLDTWTWPIRSLKFLFLRYATTGWLLKAVARSLEVCRIGQCLFMMCWMGPSPQVSSPPETTTSH